MAKYVQAVDLSDLSLDITEAHCEQADVFVDSALWQREIDPADVSLPSELLSEIAGNWAKRQSAIEGAIGEDSPLIAKAREFEKNALRLLGSLNRRSLGIAGGSAFGVATLGRG